MIIASLHWWSQLAHPGKSGAGGGYWFWSGIGSDLGELTLLAVVFAAWRHVGCHEPWCPRLGRHHHAASGTKWCQRHMPQDLRDAHPKPHVLR